MKLQARGFVSILVAYAWAAQTGFAASTVAPGGQPNAVADPGFAVTQAGPHSRVWRNPAGQTITEIATGMNYWDGQKWAPSQGAFQISPDGTLFLATRIQDPTSLAANLNCAGAVTVQTPDGLILRSTPVALCLYDTASGKSVILATVTNCLGTLVDGEDVVYEKAFIGGGFAADVIYSLPDVASFHQDVLFTAFDSNFSPTNYGFAAGATETLQVQIFTEFYDPPPPGAIMRPLYVEQDAVKRARMATPDFIDYTLDFGDYVLGPGRAYVAAANESALAGVTVGKEFVTTNGRSFLVESVPFCALEGALRGLPSTGSRTTALKSKSKDTPRRLAASSLPSPPTMAKAFTAISSQYLAASPHVMPRGVIVDYIATVSST